MQTTKPDSMIEIVGNIRAEAYLDTVERGQWPAGVFYAGAYVLISTYGPMSNKALSNQENDQAQALTDQLRTRLALQIRAQGWQPVTQTKAGLPIWLYRPGVAAQPETLEQKPGIAVAPQTPVKRPWRREKRPVTFTCQWCEREVTEMRYPSHKPLYCQNPECKKEATRKKSRDRTAEWRAANPDARRNKKS